MNSELEKWRPTDEGALAARRDAGEGGSIERRLMQEALAKLERVEVLAPARARLMFGIDLTASREWSLNHAQIAIGAMFETIKTIGAVAVKLVYYRGTDECRASQWHDDPAILSQTMQRLSCESGETQIARLLRLTLAEREKIAGLVVVGDHCEESTAELTALAEALGRRCVPLFVFHECADGDQRSLKAKPLFKRMAAASGGTYVEFKPDSGAVLRELLSSVAAFCAAGTEGVRQAAVAQTPEARNLQKRLLLLGPADDPNRR